jgi:ankyrin repeat protein
MAEPLLLVPYGDNDGFSLYKVLFTEDYSQLSWSVSISGQSQSIRNKLKNIENYFKQRHYKKEIGGRFQGKSIKDNKSDFERLTDHTSSIFLGLFLAAARRMQQRKLKLSWDSVTVTGDLEYNENTGEMMLKGVTGIDKKYRAVKDYASKHKKEKHLFVYISPEKIISEGVNGNIEVKCFSAEDSIFDIIDFVFERYIPGMEITNLDEIQKRLLKENTKRQEYYYTTTTGLEKDLQKAFSRDWNGFIICGDGTSGKNAWAGYLASYMMWTRKIYAPLWISIKNDIFKSTAVSNINNQEKKDYLISKIRGQINIDSENINDVIRELSKEQYLIIFDIVNVSTGKLNTLFQYIGALMSELTCYENEPHLVIISENYINREALPDNLQRLKIEYPPKLQPEQIEILIDYLADKNGYLEELKIIKDKEPVEYRQFLLLIAKRLGASPELIRPIINKFKDKTVHEVLPLLQNIKDTDFRDKIIKAYQPSFENLPKKVKVILFMMLNSTEPDKLVGKGELFNYWLKEHFIMEYEVATDEDIEESLKTLLDYNFIYREPEDGESKYAIKTHCFLVFTFAPEFAGEFDDKDKKYLREQIMVNNVWKLYVALRYDQKSQDVILILNNIKKKELAKLKKEYLFTAAEYSSNPENLKLLKNCMKGKIDLQDKDGDTAFLRASGYNPNPVIIQWFLEKKNLNKKAIFEKDKDGLNALCYAVMYNFNVMIIKKLVKHGFNPYKHIKKGPLAGYTPFWLSLISNTNPDICDFFIKDPRCKINKAYYLDVTKMYSNFSGDEKPDSEDMDDVNLTAQVNFIVKNQNELKDELKRSVNFPVMFALINPNIKILERVLLAGVDLEKIKEHTGVPLLLIAAKTVSRPEYFDLLVKYDCKIRELDNNGFTALHYAALTNGSIPVFNWLEKNGVGINSTNNYGFIPLHYAAMNNSHLNVTEWFLNHDTNINKPALNGTLPLHLAAAFNPKLEICRCLIENGAGINARDNKGLTPLHYAVMQNGNPEIYQYLVKKEADVNAENIEGYTPLDLAIKEKQKERVNWLKQHEAKPGRLNI